MTTPTRSMLNQTYIFYWTFLIKSTASCKMFLRKQSSITYDKFSSRVPLVSDRTHFVHYKTLHQVQEAFYLPSSWIYKPPGASSDTFRYQRLASCILLDPRIRNLAVKYPSLDLIELNKDKERDPLALKSYQEGW